MAVKLPEVLLTCTVCNREMMYNHPQRWPEQFEGHYGKYELETKLNKKIVLDGGRPEIVRFYRGTYVCSRHR